MIVGIIKNQRWRGLTKAIEDTLNSAKLILLGKN